MDHGGINILQNGLYLFTTELLNLKPGFQGFVVFLNALASKVNLLEILCGPLLLIQQRRHQNVIFTGLQRYPYQANRLAAFWQGNLLFSLA